MGIKLAFRYTYWYLAHAIFPVVVNRIIAMCQISLSLNHFIEIQLFMYRQEKVPTMRIKHLAGLLLCISYAVTAGLNMLIAPVAIFTGKVMYVVPLAPIAVNCIFIQFLPHRVVLYLLLPEQILIYYRLKSLNNQILNAVGIAKMHSEKVNLFSFKQIETAIYTTLISILDYYPTHNVN